MAHAGQAPKDGNTLYIFAAEGIFAAGIQNDKDQPHAAGLDGRNDLTGIKSLAGQSGAFELAEFGYIDGQQVIGVTVSHTVAGEKEKGDVAGFETFVEMVESIVEGVHIGIEDGGYIEFEFGQNPADGPGVAHRFCKGGQIPVVVVADHQRVSFAGFGPAVGIDPGRSLEGFNLTIQVSNLIFKLPGLLFQMFICELQPSQGRIGGQNEKQNQGYSQMNDHDRCLHRL